MEERRKLLLAMLDAVYFDTKESKSMVAIQPKAGFLTVFQVATTRNGHEVQLIKGPQDHGSEAEPCFWWRRGRVERYPKRGISVSIVSVWNQVHLPEMKATAMQAYFSNLAFWKVSVRIVTRVFGSEPQISEYVAACGTSPSGIRWK